MQSRITLLSLCITINHVDVNVNLMEENVIQVTDG